MADTAATNKNAGTSGRKSTGGTARKSTGGAAKASSTATNGEAASTAAATGGSEARSRFNAALEEARVGVAALGAEARDRASGYGTQARSKGEYYAGQLKTRAGELAVEGKARATEALSGLAKVVSDNAATVDEKLGSKYGDYARSASQALESTATKLDQKSVEQLGEDAREFVRKSPGTAVALAGLVGFLFARLLRGK